MRSDNALLLDMLIAARKVLRFTGNMTEQAFRTDEMAQSAVIRELQVIGEAARLVGETTKSTHASISWAQIAGMRNRLIHEYFDIRLNVVWDTAKNDIPNLIAQLEIIVPPE
jgi:uncharacterized protein with HEPN domain